MDTKSKDSKRRFLQAVRIGSGCVDCGTTDGLLQFDHRPRAKRKFSITPAREWNSLLNEIAKCDVRCSMCHAQRHARVRQSKNPRKHTPSGWWTHIVGSQPISMKLKNGVIVAIHIENNAGLETIDLNHIRWKQLMRRSKMTKPTGRPSLSIPIPTTNRYPDVFYQRVAKAFIWLTFSEVRGPITKMAEVNKVPVTTVKYWLQEAERRGLLPEWLP